jgi:hypothetical protein
MQDIIVNNVNVHFDFDRVYYLMATRSELAQRHSGHRHSQRSPKSPALTQLTTSVSERLITTLCITSAAYHEDTDSDENSSVFFGEQDERQIKAWQIDSLHAISRSVKDTSHVSARILGLLWSVQHQKHTFTHFLISAGRDISSAISTTSLFLTVDFTAHVKQFSMSV